MKNHEILKTLYEEGYQSFLIRAKLREVIFQDIFITKISSQTSLSFALIKKLLQHS